MLKMMFIFAALVMMFSGSNHVPAQLGEKVMFDAYNNGNEIIVSQSDLEKIDDIFKRALVSSRPMPALGVSLHDETMQDVQKGIWIRFSFGETLEIDGLSFDQLLIKIKQDMYGFNIIRGNNGKYDGRCFYIDIKNNLDELYNFLKTLPTSQSKFEAKAADKKEFGGEEKLLQSLSFQNVENGCAKIELPSINKDKEKQSTVIKQAVAMQNDEGLSLAQDTSNRFQIDDQEQTHKDSKKYDNVDGKNKPSLDDITW